MQKNIFQHIQHTKTLDDYWEQVNYLKNFKKELIKYAMNEPFLVEEQLKNIPSEIRNMVWKGYEKSLKKALKTEMGFKPKKKVPVSRNSKRINLLHELIDHADILLTKERGEKPKQLAVFRYLQQHHEELDDDGCIQEIKNFVIYWKSHRGVEMQMQYSSFCKTLSNLRKKENYHYQSNVSGNTW